MNQILYNKYDNYKNDNSHNNSLRLKKFNFFRLSFLLSFILFLFSILLLFFITYSKSQQELLSSKIIEKYKISKLYNNSNTSYNYLLYNNSEILGFIEIPKLNIYYPIFANISDDLLKIAPCRFSGPLPNSNGNLCIAGHNYDNTKFFSKINSLKKEDKIYIYDTNNNQTTYHVYDIYEVNSNDLSPLTVSDSNIKELTLVTCNNFNDNRIIVKAKE